MDENSVIEALSLLAIGMVTVFVILGLIVLLAKTLIRVINRYFPESAIAHTQSALYADDEVVTVISAAVDQLTGGRGEIVEINEIN